MKNQLINIFLFFFLNTCFAQVNVDSLRAVWNDQNQADTTRLNSIDNLIFSHYLMTNSDSTNFYAQKMFVFATEKGLKKYQANAFHNMGNYEQGNGNEPEALKYFERSLTLRQEIGDKRGIGRSLANMAIIYHNKGDILKGLDNYEKALSYFEEIDDKDLIGFVLTYIGGAYADLGNYTKAIEYTLRSMSVTEDSDNDYMRMNTLLSMGGLYWNLDNFTQSKEYYQQSQILAKKINSITGQNAALFALAEILIEEEDYNGALAYGDEILLLNEKVDNPYVTHGLYYLKGRIYQLKGNFEKALDYYEKCLKYFESIDRNYDIVWVKTYMGQVYLEKKDGKNAIKWCKEALFLAEDMKKMDHQVDACECLYKAHKMLNQSSQALAYHERFLILNDSLHKDETGKKLQQMEFDRRQLVDSLAQVKKDRIVQVLHEQEVQKKNQEKNFFLLIGVLVLLLAAGLYHRLRFVRKSREKLNIEKNRAEKSEQIKQDFLANMSHEIRTPMNAVMGMTDLALDMPLGDKQRYYLNGIKKAGDNLLHIINDILDLSKMEAGKMELDAIDFSIRDTVEQVKQMLQHRAKDKDLELLTLVESEVDDVVVGDPMRLNQVLINLMGNAIKFTLKGSVTLEVRKVPEGVKFNIIDTGIGIPEDKIQAVFDSFSQANTSDTRKYGGTGLGLSISQQLIEMMDSTIEIESKEDYGTTFSFIINFEKGSIESLIERNSKDDTIDGTILDGLKILVVDDNEYNIIVARDTLKSKANLEIQEATNGQDAIDLVRKNKFDVILMDVQMPVMNGFDATQYIRTHFESPVKDTPIIALTASVLRTDLDKCIDAGMNSYIPKPFKAYQLIGEIAEVLNIPMKKKRTSLKDAPEISSGEVTDLTYLTNFCEGDKDRIKKYIEMFLASAPAVVEKIKFALVHGDFEEVANQVHGFKTKCMMMGMTETKDLSNTIEQLCREKPNEEIIKEKVLELITKVKKAEIELRN